MKRRVAIQMDAWEFIAPRTDSTLLIALEAQRRGYELWVYTPDKLSLQGNDVTAQATRVTLAQGHENYYTLHETSQLDLRTMDVVLLRQDPPFDMAYLGTTYILDRLLPDVFVTNHPTHVRDQPEKLFPLLFTEFAPPTLITADKEAIARFRTAHKDIVLKPLYGHGGFGVMRLKQDDQNFQAFLQLVFAKSRDPWVVQPFLPEVKDQERRIILIDGKIEGIIGRLPAEGEIRSNFHAGGTAVKVKPTKRQQEVCDAIGPVLREKGILLAGVDMIGDYLTEINITSPGSLAEINEIEHISLEAKFWDAAERYLN